MEWSPLDPDYWKGTNETSQPFNENTQWNSFSPADTSWNTTTTVSSPSLSWNSPQSIPWHQTPTNTHTPWKNFKGTMPITPYHIRKVQFQNSLRQKLHTTFDFFQTTLLNHDPAHCGLLPKSLFENIMCQCNLVLTAEEYETLFTFFYQPTNDCIQYALVLEFLSQNLNSNPQNSFNEISKRIQELNISGYSVMDAFTQIDTTCSGYVPRDVFIGIVQRLGLMDNTNMVENMLETFTDSRNSHMINYRKFLGTIANEHSTAAAPIYPSSYR